MLYGEPPVKAQCLPFRQIPHTSRLFADFLSWAPSVHQVFPRRPNFSEWLKNEATRVRYDSANRERVSSVLEAQNKKWGASAKALENIARLRAGAATVVTGQQVGLFGGPLFAIFKALTAIKLADQATAAGVDCVPVFWLATTDHDLAEINNIKIPGPDSVLHDLTAPTQGVPDAPVGSVSFGLSPAGECHAIVHFVIRIARRRSHCCASPPERFFESGLSCRRRADFTAETA